MPPLLTVCDSSSFLRSDAADTKTSGNLTFNDNIKALFGTSSDLQIFHNGSNSIIYDDGGGNGELQLQTDGTSIKLLKANTNEILANFIPDGSVDLYHDASKKFETTSTGATVTGTLVADGLTVGDNEYIRAGASGDLVIFHNGNDSVIQDGGTGGLVLQGESTIKLTNLAQAETYAVFNDDGASELYHDNTKRIETTSTGATVTGTAKATTKFETDDVTIGFTSNGATSGSGNFGVASSNGGARINADSGSNAATFIDFDATNISASGGDITYRFGRGTTEGSSDLSQLIFYAHDGTNNPVITLDSTGKIHGDSLDIARDTDASAEIGRAHIGSVGFIDFAGFSHVDSNATGSYALLQSSSGQTFINGASGQYIKNRINNSDIMTVNASGVFIDVGELTLTSTDAGATENPTLDLYRNSASPADSDILGHINFSGENSAGEKIVYAEVESAINDQTDGIEDGEFIIRSMLNGTLTKYYSAGFGSNIMLKPISFTAGASTIFFEGTTNNTFETSFTVTDPTADRTITLPDATGTVQLTDGSGASLTSLNASQLTSGTVPNARLDAQLQDVAGLAVTNGGFIVGDGSNFVLETGSTARASLELGTAAVLNTGISNTNVPKFTSGVADNDFLRVDGTAIEGRSASEVLSDIGGISASSTDTLTNKTLTTPVINGFSGTGNGSITGDLTLTSTDAGGANDPDITLYRNSSSPASSDILGTVQFKGNDSAGNQETYGLLAATINDATSGSEDGNFLFQCLKNGTLTTVFNLKGNADTTFVNSDVLLDGVNLKFEGTSQDAHETTLTVVEPTSDNTIQLPDQSGEVILVESREVEIDGNINIVSTSDGSEQNPYFTFYRNSASPADGDNLGIMQFKGKNDAAEDVIYGRIIARLSDATDGTEDGTFEIGTRSGGTIGTNIRVDASSTVGIRLLNGGERNIRFDTGTAFNGSHIDLAPASATGARTITLPDATGTVLTTGNSDTPTTTTSSSDADFVLVDDGGTMKKITPANLGISQTTGASKGFAVAMAIAL